MKLIKLEIRGLYGFIDKTVDFKESINLLVGINGSGKTSVLNVINWLTTPSLPDLAVTEFKELILYFSLKTIKYTLKVIQTNFELKIMITGNTDLTDICLPLHISPCKLTNNERLREEFKLKYDNIYPEKGEVETWSFLNEMIPTPIVIGLDRNINIHSSSDFKKRERGVRLSNSPLQQAMTIANRRYSIYKSKVIRSNEKLKERLMISSFDKVFHEADLESFTSGVKDFPKEVRSLENKVLKYFKESPFEVYSNVSEAQGSIKAIQRYFSDLKEVVGKDEQEKISLSYFMNISQILKIKDLLKEFKQFESEKSAHSKLFENYLSTLNSFFQDSYKQILFRKDTGEIRYYNLDKDHKPCGSDRSVDKLSSGEKQILILFTYLVFNNSKGIIFIIDEPELSLHPKWQEHFMPSVEKLMPLNSQLLIATHSPVIVGKRKEYCNVLFPYNN